MSGSESDLDSSSPSSKVSPMSLLTADLSASFPLMPVGFCGLAVDFLGGLALGLLVELACPVLGSKDTTRSVPGFARRRLPAFGLGENVPSFLCLAAASIRRLRLISRPISCALI